MPITRREFVASTSALTAVALPVPKALTTQFDLVRAADFGDLNRVKSLLSKGANINGVVSYNLYGHLTSPVYYSSAPLHAASKSGYLKVCRFLLEEGAAVNLQPDDDISPLLIARDFPTVKILVEAGADVDAYTSDNLLQTNVISHFCENDHILQYLIESGANIDAQTVSGYSILGWELYIYPKVETVKRLLRYGADIHDVRMGETAWEAIKRRQLESLANEGKMYPDEIASARLIEGLMTRSQYEEARYRFVAEYGRQGRLWSQYVHQVI